MRIGKTITKITYEYSDGSEETIDFSKKFEPPIKPVKDDCFVYGHCGKCGLDLSKVMGYSCPNKECPIMSQPSC